MWTKTVCFFGFLSGLIHSDHDFAIAGPTWWKTSRDGGISEVLLASRRFESAPFDDTRDMAPQLRCNIWARAAKPDQLTYHIIGGASSGSHWSGTLTGFASLHIHELLDEGPRSVLNEHPVLKTLGHKIVHFVCDYHADWFPSIALPASDGSHSQLRPAHFQAVLGRLQSVPGTRNDRELSVFCGVKIGHKQFAGHQIVHCKPFKCGKRPRMNYVFFIPPPQFYRGRRSKFQPTLDNCWYGQVVLIFRMRIATECEGIMECDCAMIDVLDDYDPRHKKVWWRQVADGGTKLLYQCSPTPVTYVVPLSSILVRLALVPAGDHGTIPSSASQQRARSYPQGRCDHGDVGTGSKLFYVNMWALQWPLDRPL